MRLTLPATIDPFAGVLLLPDPNMFIMDMLDEVIHISQISSFASLPSADGHLVTALAAIVVILAGSDERGCVG